MAEKESLADNSHPMRIATRVFKGILMWQNEAEDFESMETRDDDIWICTFPRSVARLDAISLAENYFPSLLNGFREYTLKSRPILRAKRFIHIGESMTMRYVIGTTMTIELVYLIQTLDFEKANTVQLEIRVPFLDCKDDRFPFYKGKQVIDEMKSPRMIKSHLHHFLLPEQLQKGKGRIIYVVRNPKDVVVSFYRLLAWTNQLDLCDNMFDRFFDSFVDGSAYACPWPKHVLGYWGRKDDPHVLFLRYEDIVKDMPSAIRKIATFLNRTLSEEDVSKIADHCNVKNMRENETVNYTYWKEIGYVDSGDGHFINKGQPGKWHETLSPKQTARMDELIQEVEKAGLDIVKT